MKRKREHSIITSGGGWERGRLIGRGGFGSVYLAKSKGGQSMMGESFPSLMAVKSVEYNDSDELSREIMFLAELEDCPQIIKNYGDDVTEVDTGVQIYNVLLEYASGGALIDSIGCGLPEDLIRGYTQSIVLGIKYIHEHDIIHCDLKPDNILLVSNTDGQTFVPKIADFGLAKWGRERNINVRGTPRYFSPESILYGVQKAPSDIWALGCIVFMMLTGKFPWKMEPDATEEELFLQITSKSPVIPSSISREAEDFLQRCFKKSPAERWTADMLLGHPFLVGAIEDHNKEKLNAARFESSLSSTGNGFLALSNSFSNVKRPKVDIVKVDDTEISPGICLDLKL